MSATTTTDRQPQEIRYRGVPEPAATTEAPKPRPVVLEWLNWGVFVIVVAVWAVVGMVVWIPLLVREMLRFSGALVRATLHGERPTEAARNLHGAVDFYPRGFVLATDVVRVGSPEEGAPSKQRGAGPTRFGRELAGAVLIWYAIFAAFGLVWSPFEVGRWVLALPWTQWAVGVGAWIVEPFV